MPTGEKINKNELYNLNVGCSYLSGMISGGLKTEILSNSDNILDKKPVFFNLSKIFKVWEKLWLGSKGSRSIYWY